MEGVLVFGGFFLSFFAFLLRIGRLFRRTGLAPILGHAMQPENNIGANPVLRKSLPIRRRKAKKERKKKGQVGVIFVG
jgi:hypothetical protein